MSKNLITILVVIAVLVGLYYLVSPYQNCYRDFIADVKATPQKTKSDTSLIIDWDKIEEEKKGKTEREITALLPGRTVDESLTD